MPDFDRFIDPMTKKPLSYHPEKHSLLTTDEKVSYPAIYGIPRFVPPEFYEPKTSLATDEVQTGQSFGDKWGEPRSHALGSGDFDRHSLEEQFLSMLGAGL